GPEPGVHAGDDGMHTPREALLGGQRLTCRHHPRTRGGRHAQRPAHERVLHVPREVRVPAVQPAVVVPQRVVEPAARGVPRVVAAEPAETPPRAPERIPEPQPTAAEAPGVVVAAVVIAVVTRPDAERVEQPAVTP